LRSATSSSVTLATIADRDTVRNGAAGGIEGAAFHGGRIVALIGIFQGLAQGAGPRCQSGRIVAAGALRGVLDESRTHLQGGANVRDIRASIELAAPGLEMIHPSRHRIAVTPGSRRCEFGGPHVVDLRFHVDVVGGAVIDRLPTHDGPQFIVSVGEAVGFDAHGLAGNALGRKAAAVDHRQHRVNDGAYSAFLRRQGRRPGGGYRRGGDLGEGYRRGSYTHCRRGRRCGRGPGFSRFDPLARRSRFFLSHRLPTGTSKWPAEEY
jgi:hypothetical protein